MDFLTRLERRFGRFGVPNLILIIVAGRGLAYLLSRARPGFVDALVLDPAAVAAGEYWRLLTYVFIPPQGWIVWVLVELYFTYFIGSALEAAWGAFRLTLYYLLGTVATALVALFITGQPAYPTYLNLSLFLAFAMLFPDVSVMLFFVLPVKVKWLGWIAAGFLTLGFWTTGLAGKAAILTALVNFLVFFRNEIREWMAGKLRRTRQAVGGPAAIPRPAVHRCTVCGRTEHDGRELEFRICACARCGDGREFCIPHLEAHLRRTRG